MSTYSELGRAGHHNCGHPSVNGTIIVFRSRKLTIVGLNFLLKDSLRNRVALLNVRDVAMI